MSDVRVACARFVIGAGREGLEGQEGNSELVVEIDARYVYEDWVLKVLSEIESYTLEELLVFRVVVGTYAFSFGKVERSDAVVYRLGYERLVDGEIAREFDLSGAMATLTRLMECMDRVGGSWSRYGDRVLVSENAFVGSGFYMQRMSEPDGVLSGGNTSGLMWYVGSSDADVEAGALHYEVLGGWVTRYPYVRDVLVLPEDWMAVFEDGKLVGICDESSEDRMDVLK